ncbi:MAG: hypothetical protein ABIQ18_34895 [Umezawaea sp.]
MAEVLLFHHAHGLTSGVHDFARELSRAGCATAGWVVSEYLHP